jgi:hypothetical protein
VCPGAITDEPADVAVIATPAPAPALEQRNLFGEAQRIAARAASASTRRQYFLDLPRVLRDAAGDARRHRRPRACICQ